MHIEVSFQLALSFELGQVRVLLGHRTPESEQRAHCYATDLTDSKRQTIDRVKAALASAPSNRRAPEHLGQICPLQTLDRALRVYNGALPRSFFARYSNDQVT